MNAGTQIATCAHGALVQSKLPARGRMPAMPVDETFAERTNCIDGLGDTMSGGAGVRVAALGLNAQVPVLHPC